MMDCDMTYNEIRQLKDDFIKFIEHIQLYSIQKGFEIAQNDNDFFVFISKRIVFLKMINLSGKPLYFIKVLISDMYNLILTIVNNQKRYIYVNERSIIENYMRLILNRCVEKNHITTNLFDILKKSYPTIFNDEIFSLLKNEYYTACRYIHGGNDLDSTLISYFNQCVEMDRNLVERHKYYNRLKKIIQSYDRAFIHQHTSLVDVAFHRKKSVLRYLIGGKNEELLFELKKKENL